VRLGTRAEHLQAALLAAVVLQVSSGALVFGPRAIWLVGLAAGLSVACEAVCAWFTGRVSRDSVLHSIVMGLLVAALLPVSVAWHVVGISVVGAVIVGKWLMGGLGHTLWHPALVGLVLAEVMFPTDVVPARWPLPSQWEVPGMVGQAGGRASFVGQVRSPCSAEPLEMLLGRSAMGQLGRARPVLTTVRDCLPDFGSMLAGRTAGGVGTTCVLSLLAVGVLLVWRGYYRWHLPVSVLVGAALASSVLPVRTDEGWQWLPVLCRDEGVNVGLIWVCYHVLAGTTLFVAILLAGEMTTRPVRSAAQVIYGVGVGILTVALRWYGVAVLSGWWAVLAMNTLAPVLDHFASWRKSLGMRR